MKSSPSEPVDLIQRPSCFQRQRAQSLNQHCFCISLDASELERAFGANPETRDVYSLMLKKQPHMFAALPVFVSRHHLDRMAAIVQAVQAVVALPAYRDLVLAEAPQIAHFDAGGARGVFMSFDFHVAGGEPQLIEINTNAGGALLNTALARAQRACCTAVASMTPDSAALEATEQTFVDMVVAEWRLARGERVLRRLAIVDDDPQEQFLYPEFVLFRQLFLRHGIDAVIAAPTSFQLQSGVLSHDGKPVDLVYNRLTDFMLDQPAHALLRTAYLEGAIVLTPHPHAHALYANKRNLVVFSDAERLRSLGVSENILQTLLGGIPKTEIVDASKADSLWSRRRGLFFKPASGFGGRAAYRGDKLTKRAWGEVLAGEYVAQALVAPGERSLERDQHVRPLKFDVRNYVYDGDVQFVTARLYQGQTTNSRTPGGGFAPVFTDADAGTDCTPVCHPARP
ncbi:hypothetical protein [Mesorhizobium sp.]|uniref:hypothetical protein n=1 Tax=Mesorhizobium sp. TaxID=1871066 RepID=UPI0025BAA1FE|nr:hypothetical protein [Mesorhizobium sp.]